MKISKLFHWLYAFVMFLPIFAIGTACLISTFNMSSKEKTEIFYKYETNEVNSDSDLIKGNIYHFETNNLELFNFDNVGILQLHFVNINNSSNFDNASLDEVYYYDITNNGDFVAFYDSEFTVIFYYWGEDSYTSFTIEESTDLVISGEVVIDENSDFNFSNVTYLNSFSKCENIPISSVETHNLNVDDLFYSAVNKVTENPLFSWAYDSFLVAPFAYIVNLFGMPTNSVIVELLSYWLAISIIWLVFDLIMYVPLLVHRWLDKGVLE